MGWTIKNSAVAVGINYDYAQKIVSKYNKIGSESVKNGHKKAKTKQNGRKSLLTEEQLEKLKQELESLPSPEKGIWTGAKVARWIENRRNFMVFNSKS